MKIKVNIDEIEFEVGQEKGEFSFHELIKTKKILERELTKILLVTKTYDKEFLFENMLKDKFFSGSNNSENAIFVKEIYGGKFSLPVDADIDSFLVGKRLAKTVFSVLQIMSSSSSTSDILTPHTTNSNSNTK